MSKKVTIDEFLSYLDSYVSIWHRRRDEIPFAIKTSVITQIVRTGSIDTTRFIRAVDFRAIEVSNDSFRYLIDSARDENVTYDGFVEVNGETRTWTGRFNYRDGIENADLEPIFDNFADATFAR